MSNIDFQNGLAAGLSCGANIAKEVNEFIQKLPDELEDVNSSIRDENSEDLYWSSGESALFELEGQIVAHCNEDIWDLPLDKKYLYGRKRYTKEGKPDGGQYARGVQLQEATNQNGEKYRYINVGDEPHFIKKGIYNDTYVYFEGIEEFPIGCVVYLSLMEVE